MSVYYAAGLGRADSAAILRLVFAPHTSASSRKVEERLQSAGLTDAHFSSCLPAVGRLRNASSRQVSRTRTSRHTKEASDFFAWRCPTEG